MSSLPEFDRDGNLPPGVHPTTWVDFVARFGQSPERRMILDLLHSALGHVRDAGCLRIWIGGSFITDSERVLGRPPADIDVCWSMDGVDLAELAVALPALHPLHADRAEQRRRFGGDYFAVSELLAFGMVERFQRDRQQRRRGIVVLDLTVAEAP